MSQAWDNVVSMHDQYMLTNYRDVAHLQTVSCLGKNCPSVPCACIQKDITLHKRGSGLEGHINLLVVVD